MQESIFWEDRFTSYLNEQYKRVILMNEPLYLTVEVSKKVKRKKISKVFQSKGKHLGNLLSEIWRFIVPRKGLNDSGNPNKVSFEIEGLKLTKKQKEKRKRFPRFAILKKKNGTYQKIKITAKNRKNYIFKKRKVKGRVRNVCKRK